MSDPRTSGNGHPCLPPCWPGTVRLLLTVSFTAKLALFCFVLGLVAGTLLRQG